MIVDCHVTTGIASEVKTALDRVETIQKRLQLKIEELIADGGYGSADNLQKLWKDNIKTNKFWVSYNVAWQQITINFAI